jgi:hypothetical protein
MSRRCDHRRRRRAPRRTTPRSPAGSSPNELSELMSASILPVLNRQTTTPVASTTGRYRHGAPGGPLTYPAVVPTTRGLRPPGRSPMAGALRYPQHRTAGPPPHRGMSPIPADSRPVACPRRQTLLYPPPILPPPAPGTITDSGKTFNRSREARAGPPRATVYRAGPGGHPTSDAPCLRKDADQVLTDATRPWPAISGPGARPCHNFRQAMGIADRTGTARTGKPAAEPAPSTRAGPIPFAQ